MERRHPALAALILAGSLAVAPLPVVAATAGPEGPMNVLFITSDDMRPDLGCYGCPQVSTPSLDALAKAGLRFDRAYCQYPLCDPSRSSMLTGRYPVETGVLDNNTWFGALHPDWVSLPKLFRNHGYATLCAGKLFHGGIDDAEAWTEGGEKRKFRGPTRERPVRTTAALIDDVVSLPDDGGLHDDVTTVRDAIGYLRKYREQPFFLACGFKKPHAPPGGPKSLVDRYAAAETPLPVDFASTPTPPPGFPAISLTPNIGLFEGREATEADARRMKAGYWASIAWVDANVGRVLHELDELGLRERTVIVFWSDHGYHLGEKGKWGKDESLYEVCNRVPLILAAPGAKGNGQAVACPVESVDLYPTLCELCGLDVPTGLSGASLVPFLQDPAWAWDRPAYTVVGHDPPSGVAVRTDRYRYAEWEGGRAGAMLIDEIDDPAETRNRVDDPEFALVREALAKLAREHLARGTALQPPGAR